MKYLLALCLSASVANAAIRIGSESAVALPGEAPFSSIPNIRPANGATVTNNPPLFSWPYVMNPTNTATDERESTFHLQISTNADFSSPIVDVNTRWNTYNFIPPITNANGSTFLGTNWWRVGYGTVTNGVTNLWITNWFTISATHSNWDRSMLASSSYMSGITHPYMEFHASERATLYTWIKTNDAAAWLYTTNRARTAIDSAWWSTTPWPTDGTVEAEGRDASLRFVAFVASLTQESQWTNGLTRNMTNLAKWFTASGKGSIDYGNGDGRDPVRSLCHGYDLCYEFMSNSERTNVAAVIHQLTKYLWGGGSAFRGTNNSLTFPSAPVDENYPGPWYVTAYTIPKMHTSHGAITFQVLMQAPLATFNEDAMARDVVDGCANYLLGRTYLFGTYAMFNQGRSYTVSGVFDGLYYSLPVFITAFREARFERVPLLRGFADWFSRIVPPGFRQVNETWADGALGSATVLSGYDGNFWTKLSQDGNFWNTHKAQEAIEGTAGSLTLTLDRALVSYYFPTPARTTNNVLAKLFPEDGWVTGSSLPPNTEPAFTNGVMWNFVARPRGSESQHSHDNDGAFDISAYGASVTEGGSDQLPYYGKNPVAHNTILISSSNGMVGPFYPPDGPRRSNYNYITHFTNGSDFVYARADLTYGYPHESFPVSGFQRGSYNGDSSTTVPQNHILSVVRHVLNPRRKYLVFFDEVTTTTNTIVAGKIHIYNAKTNGVVSLDTGTASFSWWNTNRNGNNVTTFVFHASSPGSLAWGNFIGSPGEDVKRANIITWSNAVPATSHARLWALVPVNFNQTAPLWTNHTSRTMSINFDGVIDVVSWGETNASPASTIIIDTTSATQSEDGSASPRTIRAGRVTAGRVNR